jgi:dipeptidyl-peptidase 4
MLRFALFATITFTLSARAQEPLTVAEKSDYKATSKHSEVLGFCEALAAKSPVVRFTDMGTSGEGKKLPLLILADPPISTPAEAKASGKLVAYVQANIHAGEVDGKEGLLMLARDIALGKDRALLKNLVLLFCPDFNPDGNDKIDPNNRRSQNGPIGVGLRANAEGFDLNRDFVKLETPEVRGFVRIMNAWDPALVIDCHTTNGSYHQYTLTYDGPRHPNTGEPLVEAIRDKMLPEVGRMLEKKTGFKSFVYGNFSRDRTKWETYGHTPRYSTQYVGMRGRIGILSESYSYATYKDRIIASREFVRAWLEYLADHKDEIRKLLATNDQGTVIIVRTTSTGLQKTVALGYEEKPNDQGRPMPVLDKPKEFELELMTKVEPTEKVTKPYAYLIPPTYKSAIETLERHAIVVEELARDSDIPCEARTIEKIEKAPRAFQKHNEVTLTMAQPAMAQPRKVPAGTRVVRTAQPLGMLASYLLEPRSEDGLATWNFFDSGLAENREFPVLRMVSSVAMPLKPLSAKIDQ